MGAREPISKAKTDQQVPGAAGNSGDLPEPQNIGLLDRASQHHNSDKTPPNPKTSGSWIKPPSTTTLGEGRQAGHQQRRRKAWPTVKGWSSYMRNPRCHMSIGAGFLGETRISQNLKVLSRLISQVGHEPPLYQLTHERLIHESQATQPPLVMLAFQRMINRALGNNSSRHEYVS
ncbi:hypothetical protein SKAU_G00342100 [Synaphobranchus kaupii]|uniref:Uncharacterized protein n=1 Tax=Synaphobranchus kaupii TaxID=118154 RepID=A0A9Q1ENA8_SYNKA|nr:hypothetical protein SKAU_G00342100 [Synaphobranchus kaupii]